MPQITHFGLYNMNLSEQRFVGPAAKRQQMLHDRGGVALYCRLSKAARIVKIS